MFLTHDLSKAICRDILDALLLVDLVNWDALVLEREEEKEELVFLVLVVVNSTLVLCQCPFQLLILYEQVSLSFSKRRHFWFNSLNCNFTLLLLLLEDSNNLLLVIDCLLLLLQLPLE